MKNIGTMGGFDEKGHVEEVRRCIKKFLDDPEFKQGLPDYIKKSRNG